MVTPRTLAFCNFLIVALNFLWIFSLENALFFNYSFTDTIAYYQSYITPAKFTYKIWNFIGFTMILASYLMYNGTLEANLNQNTVKKIVKIDYLLILNQLALGLSMTLKHNDYFYWSMLCSLVCLATVIIINKRILIKKLTSNSFTRYFIRLGLGVYTGWLMFVIGFNLAAILSKSSFILGENYFFYLNLLIVFLVTATIIGYSFYNYLPSVSAVLAWGSYGVYYQAKNNPFSTSHDIKPFLICSIALGVIFTIFNYYRCNTRRKETDIKTQEPPAIL